MPVQLGQLEILADLNEIAGPMGRHRLEPQAMAVLELLAGEPGRVWSREELLDRAWPGRVVSDATLTGVVSRLRAALTTCVEDVRIETRSKRGYVLAIAQPQRQARKRWWRAIAVTMLLFVLTAAATYIVHLPERLQSLDGVRLDFDITSSSGVRVEPVIWLKEGKEGMIRVDGEQPLNLRVVPALDTTGLIRLKVEANSLSHWAGFDHVVGLGKEHTFSIGAGDGKDGFEVKFVASMHAGPQLP